jgi:hypothetical protein
MYDINKELDLGTYMLIDTSYHKTIVTGFHFVCHHSSHQMNRGLHSLMLNSLVFIDEMARRTYRPRDTWVR